MTLGLSLSAIIALFMAGLWIKNAIAEWKEHRALEEENEDLIEQARDFSDMPAFDDEFERWMRERIKRKD